MTSVGRTTRSMRRHAELDDGPASKIPYLTYSDVTMLTPATPQPLTNMDEGRKMRRGRSSARHNPYLESPMKTRYNSSMDICGSSVVSDTPVTAFHPGEISLDDALDLWPNYDGLSSDIDPNLHQAAIDSSTDSHEGLNTPPPRSPAPRTPPDSSLNSPDISSSMDHESNRPSTPTMRPATPGDIGIPFTPMDGSMAAPLEPSSFMGETSSIIAYGPPPTPMCPPQRVGILSSTSSLCVELPLSSASTASASAAPPLNILESEEESDDDLNKSQTTDENDTCTDNPTYINNNTTSPDIISEPLLLAKSSAISSPPSSPESTLSKHSHRLRIKAPPSRSCRYSSKLSGTGKSPTSINGKQASRVTKSILKSSSSGKSQEVSKIKLNFLNQSLRAKRVSYSDNAKGSDEDVVSAHFKVPLSKPNNYQNNYHTHYDPPRVNRQGQEGALAATSKVCEAPIPSTSAACRAQLVSNTNLKNVKQDGFINYIRMKTFMTHKDRDCSWNADQNIVFVNGPNGSGKSAILSGIQIVLGYKAANTNRTNSVTGFIKKGCSSATIEAWFSNTQGTLSKDTYGEQIIIMRKILMSGASTYKVGTPDKKLRPSTLNEVTRIRIALNIDPYNPCQFLQQERNSESKKAGANSKGPKKDFQMMKDATQITPSENTLKKTKENLDVIKGTVAEKKEHRKFLVFHEKQLKEEVDHIRKIEENEGIVQKLHVEEKWAEVHEREEDQKSIKTRKEKMYVQIEELKEEKKRLEDERNNFRDMKNKAEELMHSIKKEVNGLTNDKEAKTNELREVTNTLKRVQNDLGLILKAIKGYTKKITELEAQLNEDTINYEEQNQVYRNEIEKCTAAIPEMEGELETIRQKRDSIMAEKNEFIARERKGQEIVKKCEAELRQTKKEMCKKGNFGRGMIELEAMIAKTRWLSDPPVGPLGKYIQVNDEAYAPLIEHILGIAALFAFVVRTQEDFKTLKQIIDDIYGVHRDKGKGREPTIISLAHFDMTDYFKKLKMTEREFSPFRTVLSMLTITDEMAKVGVIERTGCELILLFEDNTAAAAVMKEENKVPGKMSAAYTLQWYRVTPYPRYAFQPLHGIKRHTEIIPMTQMDRETHVNEQITYEKGVIKTCRASLKGYKDGPIYRPGLENQLREEDNKLNMLNKKIHQMRNQIKHAQMMIKQSQPDNKDKNIQNQIKSEQDMKAEQEMESKVRLQEIELAKAEVTRIAAEKGNIETQIGESQQKLKELEGEYNNALGTVGKIGKEIDSYKGKIEHLERDFHQLSRLETKVVKEITERTEEAVAVGERPAILLRNPEIVRSELKELEAFLAKNGDILLRKPRILAEYEKSRDLVAEITIDIDSIDKVLKLFEPYVKVTDDHLEKRKKEISNELESKFHILCERNRLTGKLMVDWNEERIIYYVSPDKHSDARARKNFSVKEGLTVIADKQGIQNYCSNLSGGERQKSLVFFIMSIWEITNFPCHFIDEFETCMDEHSRIRIQKLLIKHAKKNKNKLFVFFTPQVLAGVPTDDPTIHFIYLSKIN